MTIAAFAQTWSLEGAGLRRAKRFAAATLLLAASSLAVRADDTIGADLQTVIDDVLAQSDGRVSGVLLQVSHPQHGKWSLSAGTSDRETGAPLDADAHFRAGSIMKPFLATVVMQLVEDGSLALDAPLNDLLPADVAGQFENSNTITLAMLLSHTGGIAEWMTQDIRMAFAMDPGRQWSDTEILASAAAQGPLFAPGTDWSYSNTDYTLVAMIVEKVLGKPWREAVRERVISPLGLTDTLLPEPGDHGMPANTLHGYLDMGSERVDITSADPTMAGAAGGGALVTTTTDLVAFFDSLRNGALFDDPATFDMMTNLVPATGPGGQDGYGLGLTHFVLEDGHELIGHTGGTAGYFSMVGYVPAYDLTVVVSQNNMSAYPDSVLLPVLAVMKHALAE